MRQLSLKEASEILRMKPDSLRKAANRGVLHAYKIGIDWVVDYDEMKRYERLHRRPRR